MGIICSKKRIAMGSAGLLMLLAAALASAQVGQVWLRTYNSGGNDGVRAMAVDLQGNVYVSGFASASNANNSTDLVTVKYWADGTEAWIRRFDGPGHGSDFPAAMAVGPAGAPWSRCHQEKMKTSALHKTALDVLAGWPTNRATINPGEKRLSVTRGGLKQNIYQFSNDPRSFHLKRVMVNT